MTLGIRGTAAVAALAVGLGCQSSGPSGEAVPARGCRPGFDRRQEQRRRDHEHERRVVLGQLGSWNGIDRRNSDNGRVHRRSLNECVILQRRRSTSSSTSLWIRRLFFDQLGIRVES